MDESAMCTDMDMVWIRYEYVAVRDNNVQLFDLIWHIVIKGMHSGVLIRGKRQEVE